MVLETKIWVPGAHIITGDGAGESSLGLLSGQAGVCTWGNAYIYMHTHTHVCTHSYKNT